jgi:D-galactarolactone cycloisomerase
VIVKISTIRAVPLPAFAYPAGDPDRVGGDPPSDWAYWPLALVGVHTDDGALGVGSVYSDVRLVRAAIEVLEPLWRDEVVSEPARVAEKLRRHAAWIGRGGTIDHTISGIDIALWDLFGQMTGQPVGRLLGGRYRERVRPYASIVTGDLDTLGERLGRLHAEGYRAFKCGWIPFGRVSAALDERIVRTAREAVGDDSDLMIDAGGNDAFWDQRYKWALRTGDMLADYGVRWLEEPLSASSLEDYVRLRERSRTPIAAGEALVGRQAFQPWIERYALDVIQPDVSKVGGISEQRRIAEAIEDHGLQYIGHGSYNSFGVAADLQLASAFPTASLIEFETDSAYMNQICNGAFRLDADGMLAIPDAPGLGITVDLDALKEFTKDAL